MSWDWSSPIALGVFLLMCGGTAVLLGLAAAIVSSGARRASAIRNRRNN
jgi:hypothetical protein